MPSSGSIYSNTVADSNAHRLNLDLFFDVYEFPPSDSWLAEKERKNENLYFSLALFYLYYTPILYLCLCYCLTGIAVGFVIKINVPMSDLDQYYLSFPGEILMQMLQMVTVPLIVTSVITGKAREYI